MTAKPNEESEPRAPLLTRCVVTRAPDGRIVTRPHVVTGPVRHFILKLKVPPAWLERAIPLNLDDDPEDAPCR